MQGVLDNAGFPAVVTAHFVPIEGQQRPRTTILIKFADEVNPSNSFSFSQQDVGRNLILTLVLPSLRPCCTGA